MPASLPQTDTIRSTYDGDGALVKSQINGVVTYYAGRHYHLEVNEGVESEQKFYTAGSSQVAVRTITGQQDILTWDLSDHLGSTSVTANADGTFKSEIKYTAFGEVRSDTGTTDTPYQYTGQLSQMEEIGLYYYGARWMDPSIAHFSQADSIVPGAGNPLAYDRFAYALYNPLRYIDPDGHASVACVDGSDRPGCVAAVKDARDLTNWTVTTAVYIAESKEIQDIRYMLSTEKGLNESESLARLTLAGLEFYGLVSDGSRYDVKDNIKRDIGETIKLNDDWFEYSTPGNIIYGFYGAAAGFGSGDLHLGAGFAQAYDYFINHEGELGPLYPQLLDTPDDYMAVEFGYQLYTKYYEPDGVLTVEEFQTLLEE